MQPFSFLRQLVVCLITLVGVNIFVHCLAQNSNPMQMLRMIDRSPPVTDLFVGHSLIAGGVSVDEYETQRPGCKGLNIGFNSSSTIEHNLLLRHALKLRPRVVFYGFLDGQLTIPASNKAADLIGNRAMPYYVQPEIALHYLAGDDALVALRLRLTSHLPLLVHRHSLWIHVERWRRCMESVGLPAQASNRFGRAADMDLLEAGDETEFAQYCAAAVTRQEKLVAPVKDMLSLVRDAGGRMVVLEMPMSSRHRQRFYSTAAWEFYRRHLIKEVEKEGGIYVVASNWMPDEAFEDSIHLNVQGAVLFSRRLAALGIAVP